MLLVSEFYAAALLALGATVQAGAGLSGSLPVDVSAGRCEVFENEDVIECTGAVRVTQGDALLSADRMKIYGAGGGDGFDKIEGEGNVRYAAGLNAVSAGWALYDGETTTITATGDVVVLQGDQVMAGGKVVYNTTTRAMVITPGADGRVRGVFHTERDAK